ncbi:hypothetical protein [Geoalkalibacter halelectricus]|uniref:hypothetical protein n=1 Tax=Geoalkalibacter halelectricus TaxID=2847045 RepID=UPI003D1D7263
MVAFKSDTKISELILQIRYFGTLRFAMITVFMVATGGLMAAFIGLQAGGGRLVVVLCGFLLAVGFGMLQSNLGAVHQDCIDHLKTLVGANEAGDDGGGQRHDEAFVDLLFGGKYFRSWEAFRKLKFSGPVSTLVLALHLLVMVLWFGFALTAACR